MRDDNIKLKVCHDPLILAFGHTQIRKLRASKGVKFAYISSVQVKV